MLKKREVRILVNILGNIILGALGVWIFTSFLMDYYFYPTLIIKIILGLVCSIMLAVHLGDTTKRKSFYFVIGYLISFITYITILSILWSRALGPISGY